jgi:O-antigen/teichoic acid export membrane protein
MTDQVPETTPPPHRAHHAAFFRQSGWLMIANIVGGAMTYSVHLLCKSIPDEEYSIFGTLLMVTACLPVLPLQMVLAQQTASTLARNRQRQLAGMIRTMWFWTFLLWAMAAVVVLLFQGRIVERWALTSPVALWVTLLAVLVSLWVPIFWGTLQGRQDFFWLGWSAIIAAAGRLGVAVLLVLALGAGATGMITGALIGIAAGVGAAIWQTRDLWSLPREPFGWRNLIRQLAPFILGFWACQILFTTDTIFAKAFFSGAEVAPYVAAGTLARGLLWLVMPLAVVMFPKLVHSHVKAEKNTLMRVVLPGTAVLAIGGGLGLWLFGPWVISVVGKPEWVRAAQGLVPWYAAAMVPLALANVLANDLLARGQFRVVPFMVVLAMTYCFALPYILTRYSRQLQHILQTLAVFNLLLLCVCAWAAYRGAQSAAQQSGSSSEASS